jgi:gamma-glutamyltranspeptidase/glutathione hydrolase
VPGFVAGIFELHKRFGSLPMQRVLEPGIELARSGLEVTPAQGYCYHLLERILTRTPAGQEIFLHENKFLQEGGHFSQPKFADTLEQLVQYGAETFYRGDMAAEIVRWSDDSGGLISHEDLRRYQVVAMSPVATQYRSVRLTSVPPPSSGGALIGFALAMLDRIRGEGAVDVDTPEGIAQLIAAMESANGARGAEFDHHLYEGDLVGWLLGEASLSAGMERIASNGSSAKHPSSRLGSTTHISVIDANGNAVALTTSTGCGSGEFVTDTGIHLNNMMGEEDLLPMERKLVPGERLTSMMAPSLAMVNGKPLLATGSAGSSRLRSAILQTLIRLLESRTTKPGASLQERIEYAVQSARVHPEAGVVHAEPGLPDVVIDHLRDGNYDLNEWPGTNLYFGGVNMVAVAGDTFATAADHRRGGGAWIASSDGSLRRP